MKVEGRIRGLSDLVIQPRTTATEGVDDTADFDVRLDPASPVTVTVDYATEDQTAFAPADFEATSGTLTFQPGDTVKTVSVPIVDDDDLAESDEEFNPGVEQPERSNHQPRHRRRHDRQQHDGEDIGLRRHGHRGH